VASEFAGQLVTDPSGAAAGGTPSRRPGPAVAEVRGVCRSFSGRPVLNGVDLRIAAGEFVALIGRSGSGKSTLLRVLAGLDHHTGGEVSVNGTVTMAFQDARLLPWRRVIDNVALALRAGDRRETARSALHEVGLGNHLGAWPLTLSGGEAQRVSLARALVPEPDLLLLDEPFAALDALTTIEMHNLVLDLWARHRPAVLLVTHDVDEALALADRVLVLAGGEVAHTERVELERPRSREHPQLIQQRNRLLAELGVDTKGTLS
jgi:sulfonate transport system ATP-binding protein